VRPCTPARYRIVWHHNPAMDTVSGTGASPDAVSRSLTCAFFVHLKFIESRSVEPCIELQKTIITGAARDLRSGLAVRATHNDLAPLAYRSPAEACCGRFVSRIPSV
jgi:hypothetical protein